MPKRLLCIWLERLHTDCLTLAEPALEDKPLVACEMRASQRVVVGVSRLAEERGVRAGTLLADARAACSDLVALDVDQHKARALHERMARLAMRYGPWVSKVSALPMDKLVVDVSGCAHLFGGEEALLADLLVFAREMGVSVRCAIADHVLGAMALAEFGESAPCIAPSGETWRALQSLPVAALGLDEKSVRTLRRLGVRRVSQLSAMPAASLRARFGAELVRTLERAKGLEQETLAMRPHVPPPRLSVDLFEAARTPEEVERHVERLMAALCDRLAEQRLGAEKLLLMMRERRTRLVKERRLCIGAAAPMRDAERWMRLMHEREGAFDPGEGIEKITLQALTTPLDVAQSALLGRDANNSVDHLIERLSARLGEDRVLRFVERDTHLPDDAWESVPALRWRAAKAPPCSIDVRRPITLFARPEMIDVESNARPLRLSWRGERHSIRRASGPERITAPWWQGASTDEHATRDYWRVETERGERLWIFEAHHEAARWYLHGRLA